MKKLLKTKKDREQFLFWVATLESGVLKKGTHALHSSEGYCCLGVGVACTTPENEIGVKEDGFTIAGGLPNDQIYAPDWLRNVNRHFWEKSGMKDDLVSMNDGGHSHKYIAKKLLETYKDEL